MRIPNNYRDPPVIMIGTIMQYKMSIDCARGHCSLSGRMGILVLCPWKGDLWPIM